MSTDHLYEASSKTKLHSPLVPPVEEVLSQRSGPHLLLLRHLMYQCVLYNKSHGQNWAMPILHLTRDHLLAPPQSNEEAAQRKKNFKHDMTFEHVVTYLAIVKKYHMCHVCDMLDI